LSNIDFFYIEDNNEILINETSSSFKLVYLQSNGSTLICMSSPLIMKIDFFSNSIFEELKQLFAMSS